MTKTELAKLNGVQGKMEIVIPVHWIQATENMLKAYEDDGQPIAFGIDKINDCNIRIEKPRTCPKSDGDSLLKPSEEDVERLKKWARDAQRLDKEFIEKIRQDLKLDNDVDFGQMCDYIKDLHARKNADYGDSFSQIFKKRGMPYALGHMEEKLNRIDSIAEHGNKVVGEKLEDSLVDLACYALMTAIELRRKNAPCK